MQVGSVLGADKPTDLGLTQAICHETPKQKRGICINNIDQILKKPRHTDARPMLSITTPCPQLRVSSVTKSELGLATGSGLLSS